MNKKILVTVPFLEEHVERIVKTCEGGDRNVDLIVMNQGDVDEEIMPDVNIVIGKLDVALLQKSECLEWLQLSSAGANGYIEPGKLPESVIVTNGSGAYNTSVSETILAYTWMLMKNMGQYAINQQQHIWQDAGPAMSSKVAKILVVGCGKIGCQYASMMKALGSYVIGVKRDASVKPAEVDEVYTLEQMDEILPQCDVVVNVLPGTASTKKVFGAKQFAQMKESAVFINAGRGDAVDQAALCDALNSGSIKAAAIDVTTPEPLPADDPLWNAKNLIITPHIAGVFHIPETMNVLCDIVCENLKRYFNGEPLKNVVNKKIGY